MLQSKTEKRMQIGIVAMIVIYFLFICWINLLRNPYFYDSDMCCDLSFMQQAWKQKTLFPSDWIFGNQLYIVATPALALLFFGVTGNYTTAMGLASIAMTAGFFASFLWMLKPLGKTRITRYYCLLSLLVLTLFVEYPIRAVIGWQIFFTMCSYYACYAITAFLGFGCYLRCDSPLTKRTKVWILIVGLLSFATGLQSVRQTSVMVLPLVVLEAISMAVRKAKKQKAVSSASWLVAFLSVCNLAGYVSHGFLKIKQDMITGSAELQPLSKIPQNLASEIMNIFSLGGRRLPAGLFCAVVLLCLIWCIRSVCIKGDVIGLKAIALLFFGIGSIYAAAVLTHMQVRNIYYFMLFPLCGLLAGYVFDGLDGRLRLTAVVLLLCTALGTGILRLHNVTAELERWESRPTEVVNYLQENDIEVIYGCWNDISVISVGIEAMDTTMTSFWYEEDTMSVHSVWRLLAAESLRVAPEKCVYIVTSDTYRELLQKSAENLDGILTCQRQFPELGIDIYTCTVNLMNPDNYR